MGLVRYPGLYAAVERPLYRSDGYELSGEGQRYLATAWVCPRHDRSPPPDLRWPPEIRGSTFGDSLTIRPSNSQIQSATSRAGRATGAAGYFGASFLGMRGVSWSRGLVTSRKTLLATCA